MPSRPAWGATLAAVAQYWEPLKDLKAPIFRIVDAPVTMPAWLAVTLGVLLAVLAVLSPANYRIHRRTLIAPLSVRDVGRACIVLGKCQNEPRRENAGQAAVSAECA